VQSIIAKQTILFIIHGYAAEIFLYIKYKKNVLGNGHLRPSSVKAEVFLVRNQGQWV
jgi:hypothetical protein